MRAETQFPVVLIHGLFGYGRTHPLWNMANPYWPEEELARINSNHLIVEVGTLSSDYDRACEVFFALRGGTVDYGEAHVEETGGEESGDELPLPRAVGRKLTCFTRWISLGFDQNTRDLAGRLTPRCIPPGVRCGSTTALELYQLLCDDAFGVGSDHRWVRSIICIAGPLSGSTLAHLMGVDADADNEITKWSFAHGAGALLGTWFKLTVMFPWLARIYDLRMPQWHQHTQRFVHVLSHRNQLHASRDGALHSLVPARRVLRNSQMKHMDKVFLLSIASSPCPVQVDVPPAKTLTEFCSLALMSWLVSRHLWSKLHWTKWLGARMTKSVGVVLVGFLLWRQLRRVNVARIPTLWGLMWLMRRHSKKLEPMFDGFEAHVWEHNDGLVNVKSMIRPWYPTNLLRKLESSLSMEPSSTDPAIFDDSMERIASHMSIDAIHHDQLLHDAPDDSAGNANQERPRRFVKGVWYVNRVAKNHFCGMWWDKDAEEMYHSLFAIVQREFEQSE